MSAKYEHSNLDLDPDPLGYSSATASGLLTRNGNIPYFTVSVTQMCRVSVDILGLGMFIIVFAKLEKGSHRCLLNCLYKAHVLCLAVR